jgi:hypothetical protein
MTLKVFKGIWFLSLIIFLAVFMYNYASLPEQVILLESTASPFIISRDVVFYGFLLIAAVFNMFVFMIKRIFSLKADFQAWFYGLTIFLNIFLLIGINFLALYNSSEKFDYPRIGVIIYGSLTLIILWTLGWPIYALSKKIFFKQSV